MNGKILVIFIAVSLIVIASGKQIRLKNFFETSCQPKSCEAKCHNNGYTTGHCKAGDMVLFCICGDCVADKCTTSCARDQLKGVCQTSANGMCECD